MSLEVGTQAPELTYVNAEGIEKNISNSGQETWVIFIPFAFTGTCTSEICDIRDNPMSYTNDGRDVVIVSCDPAPSQKAWAEELGFKGAWVSDSWPHGEISKSFDVFNEQLGCANRVSYLVGTDGKIEKIIASDSLPDARDFAQYAS